MYISEHEWEEEKKRERTGMYMYKVFWLLITVSVNLRGFLK
jgi:predicted nucleic acid-binding Zn ribbon protein